MTQLLHGPGLYGRLYILYIYSVLVNNVNTNIWDVHIKYNLYYIQQGMVDGSASKPALRQDTGFMVEKTCLDMTPYVGAFGANLMPQ